MSGNNFVQQRLWKERIMGNARTVASLVSAIVFSLAAVPAVEAGMAIRLDKDVAVRMIPSRPLPIRAHLYTVPTGGSPIASQTLRPSQLKVARYNNYAGEQIYRIAFDFNETDGITGPMMNGLWWDMEFNGSAAGPRERVPQSAFAIFSLESLTAAEALSVDWSGITNVPADIADGDQVVVLTEAEVEAFVTNGPIDLASGSTMGGAAISTEGHDHSGEYVKTSGDTMTGSLVAPRIAVDGAPAGSMVMTDSEISSDGSFRIGADSSTADTKVSVENADGTFAAHLGVEGEVTASGFSGDGSQLANLSASSLTAGTVAEARIDPVIARDAEVTAAVASHAGNAGAHHSRYTDGEAVAALAPHTGSAAAHHSRYTDTEAATAARTSGSFLRADVSSTLSTGTLATAAGTSLDIGGALQVNGTMQKSTTDIVTNLNADLVDGMNANDIIGAAAVKTPVTDCAPINQPGSYYLTRNLPACGDCISIEADDVTFDMMGFSIYRLNFASCTGDYGIRMFGRKNVEIRNGSISDFGRNGIYEGDPGNSSNIRVLNVNVMNNGGSGIALWGADNRVVGCTVTGNAASGIYLGGANNLVEGCTVTGNAGIYGIRVGEGSRVIDNIVKNNGTASSAAVEHGIYLATGNGIIRGNTVNTIEDNAVFAGDGSVVSDNNASGGPVVLGIRSVVTGNRVVSMTGDAGGSIFNNNVAQISYSSLSSCGGCVFGWNTPYLALPRP